MKNSLFALATFIVLALAGCGHAQVASAKSPAVQAAPSYQEAMASNALPQVVKAAPVMVLDTNCSNKNLFGKFAQGGGCNAFGCWTQGGSCNSFGCTSFGVCTAAGCPKKATSFHCAE